MGKKTVVGGGRTGLRAWQGEVTSVPAEGGLFEICARSLVTLNVSLNMDEFQNDW